MTNLPPAIVLILTVIAAGAGRARGGTLLAIVGVDPASARQHLAAIDTALGAQSRGVAGLSALIDQAEQAASTSSPTAAPRQHVIFQVVLRKFVKNVPPRGRMLAQVDLPSGQLDVIGANDIGYVENFAHVGDPQQVLRRRARQAP